jgi:hypothetical protein
MSVVEFVPGCSPDPKIAPKPKRPIGFVPSDMRSTCGKQTWRERDGLNLVEWKRGRRAIVAAGPHLQRYRSNRGRSYESRSTRSQIAPALVRLSVASRTMAPGTWSAIKQF